MVESKSMKIRVPATTANLGPGFDCLGLALDIWNETNFDLIGDTLSIHISGEGAKVLPTDDENLIFKCFRELAERSNIDIPSGLVIRCCNKIPISSGLGSSSAAVISGLLACRALLEINISDHDLLKIGYEFEGHLDNITACLYGGFSISTFFNEEIITKLFSIDQQPVVIVLPELSFSTKDARQILPKKVRLSDAVFNISHTALLTHALCEGDMHLLKKSMEDRLHQNDRIKLIPGAANAIKAAQIAGAIGAVLSGAGPGIIAFSDDRHLKNIARVMVEAFRDQGLQARTFFTTTTNIGALLVKTGFC